MVINKVATIKALRAFTNCGLREAKNIVEFTVQQCPELFQYERISETGSSETAHPENAARAILRKFRALYDPLHYANAETAHVVVADPEVQKIYDAMRTAGIPTSDIAETLSHLAHHDDDIIDAAFEIEGHRIMRNGSGRWTLVW